MTEIDYEKLGDAARREMFWDRSARAVVAALADQGLVVVRKEDIRRTMNMLGRDAYRAEGEDCAALARLADVFGGCLSRDPT